MALATSNAGLVLILHDADLRTLGLIVDNLSLDADVGEILGTEDNLGAVHNESNREFHGFALLSLETVDVDDVTDLNLFLMAAGFTIAYISVPLLTWKAYCPARSSLAARHQQSNLHIPAYNRKSVSGVSG